MSKFNGMFLLLMLGYWTQTLITCFVIPILLSYAPNPQTGVPHPSFYHHLESCLLLVCQCLELIILDNLQLLVHDFISKLKVYRVVLVAGGFYYLLMTITAPRTRVVPGPVLCALEALVPYIHLHSVLGFSRERKSQ